MKNLHPIPKFTTLFQVLRYRASDESGTAHQPAFSFSSDGEAPAVSITYAELDLRARRIAAHLQRCSAMGDRIVLAYPPGLDFIIAFAACVYARVIAVPTLPPTSVRNRSKLAAIVADAQPVAILTAGSAASNRLLSENVGEEGAGFTWLWTDGLPEVEHEWVIPDCQASDLVFLQYTSGSTGSPKGVMNDHSNILENIELGSSTFRDVQTNIAVSWLPTYHDFGLIAGVLACIYCGYHCIQFPPEAFLLRPYRWLKLLSDHRACLTGAPNFAYELCIDRVSEQEIATLDLSALEFAMNGAEPVRADTLRRFADRFAPCGFRREAFAPAYGLAESTLMVTCNTRKVPGQLCSILTVSKRGLSENRVCTAIDPGDAIDLVSNGAVQSPAHEVLVVHPESLLVCPEGEVGEVWVRGPSVARGYWNRSQESEATFGARPAGREERYLRTGDLGFIDNNSLYITGRLKDLMIFNGQNVFPHDVEATVHRLDPAFRRYGCAVFARELNGEQQLIIVQEIEWGMRPDLQGLTERIRTEVALQHGIFSFGAILLVRAGQIPRTSSGKIQHFRCAEMFEAGQFKPMWCWLPAAPGAVASQEAVEAEASATAVRLTRLLTRLLGVKQVDMRANLFELGANSLIAVNTIAQIRVEFGVELPLLTLFQAGTLADIAAAIDDAPRVSDGAPALPPLVPDPAGRYLPFPLNDIQKAYWIGRDKEMPLGGGSAHVYQEVRFEKVDVARLNTVLNALIQRHDMLRAVINANGTQQVLESVPVYEVKLEVPPDDSPEALVRHINLIRERLSHQVRQTDKWPLFEVHATRLNHEAVLVHFSADLLVIDASSLAIVLREFCQLYLDNTVVLEPLALTFRDYVLWEATLRDDAERARAWQYWDARLATLPPAPDLPLQINPTLVRQPRFIRRSGKLSKDEWASFKSIAAGLKLTPSAALLAAFGVMLGHWSSSQHLTVNLTLFRRLPAHEMVNAIVGDFTALTLLEVDADANSPFLTVALKVQEQLWSDLDHASVNGVEVLRKLMHEHARRHPHGMPVVFTSTLGLPDTTDDVRKAFGEIGIGLTQTPQVWLDHQVFERNGEMLFHWDAVGELFPEGMLDDMFGAYSAILASLCIGATTWEEPIWPSLDVYGGQLARTPASDTAPISPDCLHELFERQARAHPERCAVIASDRSLSYGELRHRAHSLAIQLRRYEVVSNTLIAISMEKGWEQVVAVLAVLYAGAAYLPVDPSIPAERMHTILERSAASIVLTQSHLATAIAWPGCVSQIVAVDADEADACTAPLPVRPTQPIDLAYVIYTSGSTGIPKGVAIDHRGAVNTVLDINARFRIGAQDRVFAISSLGFDLSVYDIFGPLAAGAAIVLPDHTGRRDPAHWIDVLTRTGVTVWNSVPALLAMLVEFAEGAPILPISIRLAMLSGDWIPLALPAKIRALSPAVEVVSLGGATEASIWSIFYPIAEVDHRWKSIPYGVALTNQSVRVLDRDFHERPVWVADELYIGGIGLAQGYWGDADATNASFEIDPRSGERWYRTGDIGRYLPDGNIEFLGRRDAQIKLQGYRIELGEIESVLQRHPDVASAAVIVAEDQHGQRRLLAYVVSAKGAQAGPAALRTFLAAKLPHYMIPAGIHFIDALPLSSNGKVDRGALPQPEHMASQAYRSHGGVAAQIHAIVEDVLACGTIGAHDNLFHLGASSIDAVRISNALFVALAFRPKLEEFFIDPTIDGLIASYQRTQDSKAPARMEQASSSLIIDPEQRKAFQAGRHGLRVLAPSQRSIVLEARTDASFHNDYDVYRTVRQFDHAPIPSATFAQFINCLACQIRGGARKYLYPSAGGLYPVQTYLYVKGSRIDGIEQGIYYYDPQHHRLAALEPEGTVSGDVYDSLINRPIFEQAAFALFLIADMAAIEPMYGTRSRDFCLIEAGAMAQTLSASAVSSDLGLCHVGHLDFDRIKALFHLTPNHQLVLSVLGGKRHSGPVQRWSSSTTDRETVSFSELETGEV